MLKIGITGGIGSGKSIVSGLFARLGIPVFDSDKEARQLIDQDPHIKKQLTAAFGPQIYLPLEQGLDRKKVGEIVFQDPQALETLNAITHPPVIEAAAKWMETQSQIFEQKKRNWLTEHTHKSAQAPSASPPPILYLIKEAALLFESGTDKTLDFILGIYAGKETRIRRITARDQLSRAAAENRIRRQMDEEKKMTLCDGLIINDAGQLLWPQVLAWHALFEARVAELEGWDDTPRAGQFNPGE